MEKYKVILIGESDVGKSSLVHRFQRGEPYKHATSTIGMAFCAKKIWIDGKQIVLEIWDSAGQERFRSIVPMYFKGSEAVIMVYDVNTPSTAEYLRSYWIEQVQSYFTETSPVFAFVGNKIDLLLEEDQSRLLSQMKSLQESLDDEKVISYFTSSLTGENVQHLFTDVAQQIQSKNISNLRKSAVYLKREEVTQNKRFTCCQR